MFVKHFVGFNTERTNDWMSWNFDIVQSVVPARIVQAVSVEETKLVRCTNL